MASIKELLSAMISKINGKNEGVDWNENDPESPAFVKNRPFHREPAEITVIPEITPPLIENNGGVYIYYIGDPENISIPDVGSICTVRFEGQSYECTFTADGFLGNTGFVGVGDDTGEPFLIDFSERMMATATQVHGTISCTAEGYAYHVLPLKYVENGKALDRIVQIDAESITLEEAKELQKLGSRLIIWGNYIFKNIRISSDESEITMKSIDNEIVSLQKSNELFGISSDLVTYFSCNFPGIRNIISKNMTTHICVRDNKPYICVEPISVSGGNATETTLFKVEKNGLKNGQDFEVLGNGTIKAYSVILPSATEGSTKKFRITVDDTGALSTTEVTE